MIRKYQSKQLTILQLLTKHFAKHFNNCDMMQPTDTTNLSQLLAIDDFIILLHWHWATSGNIIFVFLEIA